MSEVLSPFQIAKAWGVDDRDIGDFLEKEGVKPVHSFKYGKGMCRLYPKDQALALYAKYKSGKRASKSNDSLSRWNDIAKISADTRETAGRIEAKLDKILSQLGVQ